MRITARLSRLRRRWRIAGRTILPGAALALVAAFGASLPPPMAVLAPLLSGLAAAGLLWLVTRGVLRERLAEQCRRRAQRRLERQRALFQSTLENLGEGLSVFSRSGRLIAWNSRFAELLGLSDAVGPAATLQDLMMRLALRGDFGKVEPETEVVRRVERFYRNVPIASEHAMPGGRILRIGRRAAPSGSVVTVYSDITELKAFERRLIEARSQAELASHSKSEFLANMSHELRTPLNAIIGFSEIIANQIFGPIKNPKYLEYLGDIHASSLHLLSIINDVLDMSKIEAGRLELSKEILILQHVIRDALRMVQERAMRRGISLIEELAADEVAIWADERATKQIALNLLSNAIKFSNEGSEIRVRVRADPDRFAVFEVADHGIGMTEEEQERALQPFGQANPTMTSSYGGTGLGLSITKGLVEAHGGSLTIFSRVGEGTTVRALLPLEPGAAVPVLPPAVEPQDA